MEYVSLFFDHMSSYQVVNMLYGYDYLIPVWKTYTVCRQVESQSVDRIDQPPLSALDFRTRLHHQDIVFIGGCMRYNSSNGSYFFVDVYIEQIAQGDYMLELSSRSGLGKDSDVFAVLTMIAAVQASHGRDSYGDTTMYDVRIGLSRSLPTDPGAQLKRIHANAVSEIMNTMCTWAAEMKERAE